MAKRANVFAIWAAYGARHPPLMYSELVRVSHWTAEEIALEESLKAQAKNIRLDYIARNSFAEVPPVMLLEFGVARSPVT